MPCRDRRAEEGNDTLKLSQHMHIQVLYNPQRNMAIKSMHFYNIYIDYQTCSNTVTWECMYAVGHLRQL